MSKVKSLTPRQEDRRDRILSSAREMVAEHGYDGMVMSQVAERAAVSPTTLYNLYNTKDQLIMESLRHLLAENAREVTQRADGTGWHYVYETVRSGALMAMGSPGYADAMLTALQRARAGDELVRLLIEDGARDMKRAFETMLAKEELLAGTDTWELALIVNAGYWSNFIYWNKGLLRLQQLEYTVLLSFLSLLIPHTTGDTRAKLQARLQEVMTNHG